MLHYFTSVVVTEKSLHASFPADGITVLRSMYETAPPAVDANSIPSQVHFHFITSTLEIL